MNGLPITHLTIKTPPTHLKIVIMTILPMPTHLIRAPPVHLVSRKILIPKMAKFEFSEKSCKLLIDNYLPGRRTRVKVK